MNRPDLSPYFAQVQRFASTDPDAPRFIRRISGDVVVVAGGCWEWAKYRSSSGYGMIHRQGKPTYVHRVAYEMLVGPIPDGLHLDHLCRNPPCCNPLHLEPVTPRENWARGTSPSARNLRKTHCVKGHALVPPNLYMRPDAGGRCCRACFHLIYLAKKARRQGQA